MNTPVTMHFTIEEMYASQTAKAKGINNKPSVQQMINLVYLCAYVLEPLRVAMNEPIKIGSGFRCQALNKAVGGVYNSQHLKGQAADIRPKDPKQFQRLVDFLRHHELTDQLLTGNGWLHISWNPTGAPRHFVRIGYYK